MSGADLTERYLRLVRESGSTAPELTRHAVESDLLMTAYRGDRFLSRPVFLEAERARGLGEDLAGVFRLLTDLPRRLFGGDRAAFATAVGLTDLQVRAIEGPGPDWQPITLCRADMHRTPEGYRILEVNTGAALGGYDIGELCRALLQAPVLAEFVERERLTYEDTALRLGQLVLASAAHRDMPSRPFVALVDWPSSFVSIGRRMGNFARLMERAGFDAAACHVGQVERRDGRLVLDGRPIDIVYRFFLIEDVMDSPEAPALMAPLVEAYRAGEVFFFVDLASDVFGSKGALALLSDDRYRAGMSADDAALVDRLLPWTRRLEAGETAVPGGGRQDLVDYVLGNRSELILKAPNLHGGASIVPGWTSDDETWRREVDRCLREPTIVQRRVAPLGEPFLLPDGRVQEMLLNWGVFMIDGSYGGSVIRATPDPSMGVLSMAAGARVTCSFHQSFDA